MTDVIENRKYELSAYVAVAKKNKIYREKIKWRYIVFIFIIGVFLIACSIFLFSIFQSSKENELTEEVLQYQPMIEKYAAEYKIENFVPYLLAIMQVESGGLGEDVMQCSESLGLEQNTLKAEESIQQGCRYFSELIQIAEQHGCDLEAAIQAYNYGSGYLYYIAENGRRHTSKLAEQFAKTYSNNKKVEYNNPIAIRQNGGWRYGYGNMFYRILVQQYVPAFDDEWKERQ